MSVEREIFHWLDVRRSGSKCRRPDKDDSASQKFENLAIMEAHLARSAKRRLEAIAEAGLCAGCDVRMFHTKKIRKIESITADGRIKIEGAYRLCSPSDVIPI